jgi:serine/threonine-protein kinase
LSFRNRACDLGLSKAVDEADAQTTISASGAFAGTPEFASPEQIIGGEVDIRSDLYSLGVSLWQMLTGRVPFRGSAGVVMAQHQHTPVPLERLESIPQPVVSLIAALLEKDPGGIEAPEAAVGDAVNAGSAHPGALRAGHSRRWPTSGIGPRCDGRYLQGSRSAVSRDAKRH